MEFVQAIQNYDIIFLSECWINSKTSITLDNYTCFKKTRKRKKRAKRDSGGLCIFVKNKLAHLFTNINWSYEDGIVLKIKNEFNPLQKHIYFIFTYMKPSSSSRNNLTNDLENYDLLYEKICELRKEGEIILIGDLNARTGNLNDLLDDDVLNPESHLFNEYVVDNDLCIDESDLIVTETQIERFNEDTKTNDFGHRIINICQMSGLLICNGRMEGDKQEGKFTYIDKKGKSTIDYAIISKGLIKFVKEFHVQSPTVFSDHSPIVLNLKDLNLCKNQQDNSTNTSPSLSNNKKYIWNDTKFDEFTSRMNNEFSTTHLISIIDVLDSRENTNKEIIDECINGLNNVLDYAAQPFTSNKKSVPQMYPSKTKHNNKWYDTECKDMKKSFDIAIQLYQHTNDKNDLENLCNIRNSYRKLCRKKSNQYNTSLANDLVALSYENPKLFWKKVKKKHNITPSSCDFHSYFKNLYESQLSEVSDNIKLKLLEHEMTEETNNNAFLDSEISISEIEKALKKLNNNKSPGNDNIINELLKNNTAIFKKALLCVFNAILNYGYFPNSWATGLIIPIYKKGNTEIAENYRGITLLSCMGKLFTNILNNRLNKWAENNSKFDQFQYGFRENKSTIDAMFILQSNVELLLCQKKALYVSFIDFRKAFDSTNHSALWYKLHENGVSSKLINLIKDMYSKMQLGVKSCISKPTSACCINESNKNDFTLCNTCMNSCYFSPQAGVFQGESLSPFLFTMYLNDINNYMKSDPDVGMSIYQFFIILLLFADDMVLFSDNRVGLQKGLDRLHSYCIDWGLQVNIDKTKCMVFKHGGKTNILDKWFYNGNAIETVSTFRYLGFVFSSSGRFKKGIENLSLQGHRAMFSMAASIDNFTIMHPKMKISFFDSLVKSVICYGCEIWGFSEAKKLDTLHLKFLKQTLRVRKSTPNCYIYKECDVLPLYVTRLLRIIKFWLKIISMDNSNPVKIIYNTTLELNRMDNPAISCHWTSTVKNILYSNGFGYIWDSQYSIIDVHFFNTFKTRIIDCFWQNNQSEINSLSVNRLYRHLNSNGCFYLTQIPDTYIRTALTKLRLGSHNFNIERGRWRKLELIDRICFSCGEIEDEYHVVMCCTKYDDLRQKYLPSSLFKKPSMLKFINYLNCENKAKLKKLGIFLHWVYARYEKDEIYG